MVTLDVIFGHGTLGIFGHGTLGRVLECTVVQLIMNESMILSPGAKQKLGAIVVF